MHPDHQRALPAEAAAGCHAVARCDGQACFQVRVEAPLGRRPVLHWANACAAHIGDLVEGVKAWAHDGNLTGATLTVLVVDPAAASAGRARWWSGCMGGSFGCEQLSGKASPE